MIPRRVKRMFDQRGEPRDAAAVPARIEWGGQSLCVGVVNLSASGAMVMADKFPHVGERVTLLMAERAPIDGAVQWVRDGRIGLHFDPSVR